jgi:spore coat protein CotH
MVSQPIWRQMKQLYTALHSDNRLTEPSVWRSVLEQVFDVDTFIRAVAAAIAAGNGNSYGRVYDNYMLYSPPCGGPMVWVPQNFDGAWVRLFFVGVCISIGRQRGGAASRGFFSVLCRLYCL